MESVYYGPEHSLSERDYSYWGHVAEGSLRKGVHCTAGKVQTVLDSWFDCSCYCSMFAVYLCVDGCKGTYVPLPVYGDQRSSYESWFPCQAWQPLPLHWAAPLLYFWDRIRHLTRELTDSAQVKYNEPLVNRLSPGITGVDLHASSPFVCVHLAWQWICPPSWAE